jgi:large-conductance mechanosensitive channel
VQDTKPSLTAAKTAGVPTINCVVFLQATFDFIIIAFVIFVAVKQVNRFKKEAPLLRRNFPRCGNEKTHTIDDLTIQKGNHHRHSKPPF